MQFAPSHTQHVFIADRAITSDVDERGPWDCNGAWENSVCDNATPLHSPQEFLPSLKSTAYSLCMW
jgi:hypothetical protein